MLVHSLLISSLVAIGAPTPEELKLVTDSLRPGEASLVAKALGDVTGLPLYRADLDYNESKRLVVGDVSISFTPKKDLDDFLLRTIPNANHAAAVALSKAVVNDAPAKIEQPDQSLYRIRAPQKLKAGQLVVVTVHLMAKVPIASATEGFGSLGTEDRGGDYGIFSASREVVSLAGVLPMIPPRTPRGAIQAAPSGIGDLGTFDPSNFIVTIAAPTAFSATAPGARVGQVPDRTGKTRWTYATGAAREFPIVLIRDAAPVSRSSGELRVEAVLLKENQAMAEKVLDHTMGALEELQKRLGPIAHRDFRVVEAQLGAGAGGAEFPGFIVIASSLLTTTTNPSSVFAQYGLTGVDPAAFAMIAPLMKSMMESTLEFTIAHEVAHQYTAMLVGNDPIEYPCADEPLTQHLALLVLEGRHDKATADNIRDTQLKMTYQLMRLLGRSDEAANRPTSDFANNLEYGALVYGKAPFLYDAQRALVGNDAWYSTLRSYVEQNRYGWVTPKTLTNHAAKLNPSVSNQLQSLRRRWMEERHGDEDLGTLDLDSLFQGQGGASGALPRGALDPKVLEAFEEAIRALSGE